MGLQADSNTSLEATGYIVRIPDLVAIRSERDAGRRNCSSYAQGVHPNPRFYKYYWWVFWSQCIVDGHEFLSDAYRLSTAAALKLSAKLKDKGEPFWLYNIRLPRRDAAIPFDFNSPRWRNTEWAPSYDEDADPIAPEPLAGHK